MEKVIVSKEQFSKLTADICEIKTKLKVVSKKTPEQYLDNQEFLLLMKVSKRTAQYWRAQGKISFSRVGNKIYYRLSDVEKVLRKQYFKSLRELTDNPFSKKDLLVQSKSKASNSINNFKNKISES